jgi:hypothetical protein
MSARDAHAEEKNGSPGRMIFAPASLFQEHVVASGARRRRDVYIMAAA